MTPRGTATRSRARARTCGSTTTTSTTSGRDRKSTRLNSSHGYISYAGFCLKKKQNLRGDRIRRLVADHDWSPHSRSRDLLHQAHVHLALALAPVHWGHERCPALLAFSLVRG